MGRSKPAGAGTPGLRNDRPCLGFQGPPVHRRPFPVAPPRAQDEVLPHRHAGHGRHGQADLPARRPHRVPASSRWTSGSRRPRGRASCRPPGGGGRGSGRPSSFCPLPGHPGHADDLPFPDPQGRCPAAPSRCPVARAQAPRSSRSSFAPPRRRGRRPAACGRAFTDAAPRTSVSRESRRPPFRGPAHRQPAPGASR